MSRIFKEEFDEDAIILTLVPATEEEEITGLPTESVWSTIDHRPPFPPMTPEVSKPKAMKLNPSLPSILPPVTEVYWNTLREWCRFCNLSTDGKKVEVYLRLQQHSYSDQQCLVPKNSLEAKMKPKCKMVKNEPTKITITGLRPQDSGIVEVMTPGRVSILAAWGRITNRTGLPMTANRQPRPSNVKNFLPPAPVVR
ncbi:hypothetical protein NN561_017742 [Cricetulus griseus]